MWARYVTIALGLWLMVAPGIFDFPKTISDNGHIVGPLIITFSTIAIFEVMRNLRYANLPLGAWLLFAPWILDYDNSNAFASDYVVGMLTLILSLVRQKRQETFDGGWSSLWSSEE